MLRTLSNKLYQFEMLDREECKEIFMIFLAQDIIQLLNKLKASNLFYTLTPHEREVANKVQKYYDENNELLMEAC